MGRKIVSESFVDGKHRVSAEVDFENFGVSGFLLINDFWREHILNLFFQGFTDKVKEEIDYNLRNMEINLRGYLLEDILDVGLEREENGAD